MTIFKTFKKALLWKGIKNFNEQKEALKSLANTFIKIPSEKKEKMAQIQISKTCQTG